MSPEEFYNQESNRYSQKRYLGEVDTYVKYLFRHRLNLVLEYVEEVKRLAGPGPKTILEVGTADGVVLRRIQAAFPSVFNKMIGVDIAEGMIVKARELSKGMNIDFFKKEGTPDDTFDVQLLVGFMNARLIETDRDYISAHLKKGGYAVLSLAGRNSIQARLKVRDQEHYQDYVTYARYRSLLLKNFKIVETRYYGFFVPKLWSMPRIARFLQPIFDRILAPFVPELFHEALYLLQLKGD